MAPYYTQYNLSHAGANDALRQMRHWTTFTPSWCTAYLGTDDDWNTLIFVQAGFRNNVLIAPTPIEGKRLRKSRRTSWVHEIKNATGLTCDARSHVHFESELFEVDHGIDHSDQPFLCVSDDRRAFLFRPPGVSSAWSQRWSKRVSEGPSFEVEAEASEKCESVAALARALSMVALKGKA